MICSNVYNNTDNNKTNTTPTPAVIRPRRATRGAEGLDEIRAAFRAGPTTTNNNNNKNNNNKMLLMI